MKVTLLRHSTIISTEGDAEVEVSTYGLNAITVQLRNGDCQCHVTLNDEEAVMLADSLRAFTTPSES